MGCDWFICDGCNQLNHYDDDSFIRCDCCGCEYCCSDCGDVEQDSSCNDDKFTCKFCRFEDVRDLELLQFAQKKLNLSKEELKQEYIAWVKSGKQTEEVKSQLEKFGFSSDCE